MKKKSETTVFTNSKLLLCLLLNFVKAWCADEFMVSYVVGDDVSGRKTHGS